MVAVSQDDPTTTSRFNTDLGVRVQTLYDAPPWKASETLGLASVPVLFLVGSDGVVRESVVGFQKASMEDLARRAAALAGRPHEGLFRGDEEVPALRPG